MQNQSIDTKSVDYKTVYFGLNQFDDKSLKRIAAHTGEFLLNGAVFDPKLKIG